MRIKRKFRILSGALAAVLVIAPTIHVGATGTTYSGNSYAGTGTTSGGSSVIDQTISGGWNGTGTTSGEDSIIEDIISATPVVSATPMVSATPTASATPSASASPSAEASPSASPAKSSMIPEETVDPVHEEEETPVPESKPTSGVDKMGVEKPAAAQIPEKNSVSGIETTIEGVYLATAVSGCAVITDSEAIRKSYGLSGSEQLFAKFANLIEAERPTASKMLDLAAASQGAEICAKLSIELGKMDNGNYSLLTEQGAEIQLMFGIPERFIQEGKSYAVVCVRRDGSVYIFTDQDQNPNTVTFGTTGGAGAYGLIRY